MTGASSRPDNHVMDFGVSSSCYTIRVVGTVFVVKWHVCVVIVAFRPIV